MTTAYFLKKRTTKKACHRASFQTARVRRLVRRKHRGELAPHTRNVSLPRSTPYCKEIPLYQLCGAEKEDRQLSAYTLALYHIFFALSIEYKQMFVYFYSNVFLQLLDGNSKLRYNKDNFEKSGHVQ